ncbi:MAG: nucleotidyltransferase [Desulfobacteraceae bacterium IS3]|nr:MAG: nucleotidyltransferase [Desulfobacteraceae bacterium IS3]
MMNMKEIRWKQRFQNYEKAFLLLDKYIAGASPSELECAGIIQFFEMTFELAWKLMKDYLESQGFIIKSPRDAVKQAFQSQMIRDGHVWIEALENRNLSVHTYNQNLAAELQNKIKELYHPALKELYDYLKNELRTEKTGC